MRQTRIQSCMLRDRAIRPAAALAIVGALLALIGCGGGGSGPAIKDQTHWKVHDSTTPINQVALTVHPPSDMDGEDAGMLAINLRKELELRGMQIGENAPMELIARCEGPDSGTRGLVQVVSRFARFQIHGTVQEKATRRELVTGTADAMVEDGDVNAISLKESERRDKAIELAISKFARGLTRALAERK